MNGHWFTFHARRELTVMSEADRRVAIITGGSQGIGAGLVAAYRKQGWAVVASARTIKPSQESDLLTVAGDIAEPATAAQNQERKTRRLAKPVLAMGGAESLGSMAADTMKLVADDVQTLVIPGIGHWLAEQAPEEMQAALTAFLAPYRDGTATAPNPRPHATAV